MYRTLTALSSFTASHLVAFAAQADIATRYRQPMSCVSSDAGVGEAVGDRGRYGCAAETRPEDQQAEEYDGEK